jgi:transcriptional regulator with XRE-family HTH domain
VQHVRVRDWTTSTLGERVKHMGELRGVTLNKLGEKAGIKSGPMSRLSRMGVRTGGYPATLQRLAFAWEIDLDWLVDGRGTPEKPRPVKDERSPNRARAIEIARAGGMAPEVIDRIAREAVDYAQDPPILWWLKRMIVSEQLYVAQEQYAQPDVRAHQRSKKR